MSKRNKDSLRQQKHHPKGRTAAPKEKLLDLDVDKEELLDLVVDVGTRVWRLQQSLRAAGELPNELRKVVRDVESIGDTLTQRGIEIKDHTDQDYDPGMALRVITSQPVPGLTRKQIIETLKPTIYYRDKIIQMGDVIVGVPEESGSSELAEETTQMSKTQKEGE